jgi:hypothetical protein
MFSETIPAHPTSVCTAIPHPPATHPTSVCTATPHPFAIQVSGHGFSRAVKRRKKSFLTAVGRRAAKRSDLKTTPFLADGSALPSASIVQCAFPGTPRERASYSADNRQRGFLPPVRRNRCVPWRRRHSARRSTYQSVPGFPILH